MSIRIERVNPDAALPCDLCPVVGSIDPQPERAADFYIEDTSEEYAEDKSVQLALCARHMSDFMAGLQRVWRHGETIEVI